VSCWVAQALLQLQELQALPGPPLPLLASSA